MSKSSALSISVLLIFEMQLINGGLFLKANSFSYAVTFVSVTLWMWMTRGRTILMQKDQEKGKGASNI